MRRIAKAAGAKGLVWQLHRQGAGHEIWICGSTPVPVPRHKEIGNNLAEAIFAQLQAEIGKDWWRK